MKRIPYIRTEIDPERETLFARAAAAGPAAAATADPVTSDIAAERVEASGVAGSHRRACLAAVLAHPGSTSAEIADFAGIERHQAARRLPELWKASLLSKGARRKCSVNGTLQVTWGPRLKEESK